MKIFATIKSGVSTNRMTLFCYKGRPDPGAYGPLVLKREKLLIHRRGGNSGVYGRYVGALHRGFSIESLSRIWAVCCQMVLAHILLAVVASAISGARG